VRKAQEQYDRGELLVTKIARLAVGRPCTDISTLRSAK
jgi:hypothetical protein